MQRASRVSIAQIFENNTGPAIHKWTHYFPIYERHFSEFRGRRGLMIEIGSGHGGSSRMWRSYFGPAFQIVTLDIRPECKELETDQIAVRIGSQDDERFLSSVVDEFGAPDIVLDDGSHVMQHVCTTFRTLYPRMAPHSLYMVEDLHTAYMEEYGGGVKAPGSFMEVVKGLIDEMHAHYARGAVEPTQIADSIRGMHIYDSIVALERGQFVSRRSTSSPRDAKVVW